MDDCIGNKQNTVCQGLNRVTTTISFYTFPVVAIAVLIFGSFYLFLLPQ